MTRRKVRNSPLPRTPLQELCTTYAWVRNFNIKRIDLGKLPGMLCVHRELSQSIANQVDLINKQMRSLRYDIDAAHYLEYTRLAELAGHTVVMDHETGKPKITKYNYKERRKYLRKLAKEHKEYEEQNKLWKK